MNIKFNISPSSLNQYNESQLVFYYNQIKKAKPDTKTYECYGKGGTAVHEVLDRIAKNPENLKNWQTQFQNLWVESDLHFLKGFNSQPLSQNIYRECVEHGIHLIKNEYKIVDPELNIEIPFKNNSKFKINFKGKIDVVGYKGDKKVVMDYKTSSSMDSDTRSPGEPYSNFQLQGLFYAWLLWKKKGFLVDEVIFEYLKLKKPKSFPIKEEDLIKFEKYLYKKAEEIFSKGSQIECYEIGKINSPWNQHKIKCETEKARRNSKQKLIVERGRDNTCTIMTKIYDSRLIKALREKYSYDAPGSHFSEKFINKVWDGKKYLFQNQNLVL